MRFNLRAAFGLEDSRLFAGLILLGISLGLNFAAFAGDAHNYMGNFDSSARIDSAFEDSLTAIQADTAVEADSLPNTGISEKIQPAQNAGYHSPSGAMWRSVLLPGWGQLYNRKYLKSLIIGGGEIAIIYGIWYQHNQYHDARDIGDTKAADFYRDDRNRLTWWLAGIILYSMADAYVDAHLMNFDLGRDLSLGLNGGCLFIRLEF